VGEELGGFAEAAAVEFTLDAGFGGGVEGQAHGESMALAVLVKCWFRRRQVGRCACGSTPACGRVEPTHPHEAAYEWKSGRA
jgi:hypothetical protein